MIRPWKEKTNRENVNTIQHEKEKQFSMLDPIFLQRNQNYIKQKIWTK